MLKVEQAEELKASVDRRGPNADTLLALIELLTDTIEPEIDDVPDVE